MATRGGVMGLGCEAIRVRDFPALKDALLAADLPVDDVDDGLARFYRFARDGRVCAYGGIEVYGRDALLRSIVVMPTYRKSGLGRQCVAELEAIAREKGVGTAYLATVSAEGFFRRLDYAAVSRDALPAVILATRQLSGICPASATVMMKVLATYS